MRQKLHQIYNRRVFDCQIYNCRIYRWAINPICIGLITFSLLCWGIASQTRLTECLSKSLDGVRYILFLKNSFFNQRPLRHGDIVLIQGHQEDHVGDMKKWPYSKRVLGLPGDKIVRAKGGIKIKFLNYKSGPSVSKSLEFKTLPLLKKTKTGKPLTPLSTRIIPYGYVFVAGDNLNSFDSRYEEFGLVPLEKIWGKAVVSW